MQPKHFQNQVCHAAVRHSFVRNEFRGRIGKLGREQFYEFRPITAQQCLQKSGFSLQAEAIRIGRSAVFLDQLRVD